MDSKYTYFRLPIIGLFENLFAALYLANGQVNSDFFGPILVVLVGFAYSGMSYILLKQYGDSVKYQPIIKSGVTASFLFLTFTNIITVLGSKGANEYSGFALLMAWIVYGVPCIVVSFIAGAIFGAYRNRVKTL